MFTLFSLFVSLFVTPATSKHSEAGNGALIMVFFMALVAVAIVFIALPMLGLGTATAQSLQQALGQ